MNHQPRRFLRLPEVKHQVGLGRTAIYQKIKAGEFPAPYPLSKNGRAVAWASDQIETPGGNPARILLTKLTPATIPKPTASSNTRSG